MAQPSTDQEVQALVLAQAAARTQTTAQAAAIAQTAAQHFTGWYDTAAITAWAATLAIRIEGLQRLLARTTDAYLARALTVTTGRRARPVGAIDVSALRQGITHAGAYARAADVYRWQQAQFDRVATSLINSTEPKLPDLIDPIQAAVARVTAVTDMDAQLTARAQAQATLSGHAERSVVTGYRRVIHPELSKGGTCGLCIAASDRLYHVKDLMPVHARCECTILPVLEGADPGSQLNAGDLKRLYREAGSTGRADLKRTRYQVDEHGELGPLLNPAGAQVRTARQADLDVNRPPRQPKSDAQIAAQVGRIRDQLAAALPKAQALAQDSPKTWGDYLTKLETRIRELDQQLAA